MQLGAFSFGPARSIFGGGNARLGSDAYARLGSGGFAADFEMGQLLQANALEATDKEEEEEW